LAPTQAIIIPITDSLEAYALKVKGTLVTCGVRVDIDNRNETLQKRIRNAELNKTPYILVIGEREAENSTVAVRKRKEGDLGSMPLDDFVNKVKLQITSYE
jgi:threonyl-tRNA synthetase